MLLYDDPEKIYNILCDTTRVFLLKILIVYASDHAECLINCVLSGSTLRVPYGDFWL